VPTVRILPGSEKTPNFEELDGNAKSDEIRLSRRNPLGLEHVGKKEKK
jgi:hypothetical protein